MFSVTVQALPSTASKKTGHRTANQTARKPDKYNNTQTRRQADERTSRHAEQLNRDRCEKETRTVPTSAVADPAPPAVRGRAVASAHSKPLDVYTRKVHNAGKHVAIWRSGARGSMLVILTHGECGE